MAGAFTEFAYILLGLHDQLLVFLKVFHLKLWRLGRECFEKQKKK